MNYEDIELAFHFVSGAPPGERSAVINRITGESYYAAVMSDSDELPDDVDGNDDYVAIPHKNELDLGKPLVLEFVRTRCPELTNRVLAIFSRRGAYGRYKDLLAEKNRLEEWYAFENERTREALLKWCEQEGVVVQPLKGNLT